MNNEIEEITRLLTERYPEATEEVKEIIAKLIQETLSYRDELKAKGSILTVQDVQDALDEYLNLLNGKGFSKGASKTVRHLVCLWLKKINVGLYH